jgi:hypothetical protein
MNFGKIGLRLVSEYNHDGIPCVWYELDKINYQNENSKIAGVPEHFNSWHLAIENKEFESHDINLKWTDVSNAGRRGKEGPKAA